MTFHHATRQREPLTKSRQHRERRERRERPAKRNPSPESENKCGKRIKRVRGGTGASERVRGHQRATERTEKRPAGTGGLSGRHKRTGGSRERAAGPKSWRRGPERCGARKNGRRSRKQDRRTKCCMSVSCLLYHNDAVQEQWNLFTYVGRGAGRQLWTPGRPHAQGKSGESALRPNSTLLRSL
jgi:hypothetical protein